MFKFFYSLKSSHIFLKITTVICTISGFSHPLLAIEDRDILSEAESQDTTPLILINSFADSYNLEFEETLPPSHSAQFLLTQEIDWDTFCEKFPQNSMCQVEREQEEQPEPEQSEAEQPEQPEQPEPEQSEAEQSEQPKPPEQPEQPEQSEPEQSEAEQPEQSESESDSNNEQKERKLGPLNEHSGVAFEPQVSSLGLGMDITARVAENVNARAGFGIWSLTEDYKRTDVKYNADIKLRSGAAVMDIYPIADTEFRLSGGLILNGNKVNSTGQSETVVVAGVQQQVYTIGGRTFTADQVGTLSGEITFPLVAPFVGVGWGNAVKPGRRLGFTVDLGVMIHGTPQISLRATNQSVTPNLQTSIDKEIEDLKAEFDGFKFYPVLQVGISYQF